MPGLTLLTGLFLHDCKAIRHVLIVEIYQRRLRCSGCLALLFLRRLLLLLHLLLLLLHELERGKLQRLRQCQLVPVLLQVLQVGLVVEHAAAFVHF